MSVQILIAEDEPVSRLRLAAILRKWNYEVIETADGAAAWSVLARADAPPVGIIDWMMPEIDGVELCRRVRALATYVPTYLILLTAKDGKENAIEALESGADDYLLKPFDPDELHARLQVGLRLRQLQSAHAARVKELETAHAETEAQLAAISSFLIGLDQEGRITRWNRAADEVFQIPARQAVGCRFDQCPIPWSDPQTPTRILALQTAGQPTRLDALRLRPSAGGIRYLTLTVVPNNLSERMNEGLLLLGMDVTEHRQLEDQLRQAQKLEAIGQLAAGIAHEINTPIQYVGDNTVFLRDAFGDLWRVMDQFDRLVRGARFGDLSPNLLGEVSEVLKQTDLDYLREEIPRAIDQSLEGVQRVAHIVRAMKEFSHPGSEEKTSVDINRAIENTITVARNEWRYVADVVTDFDPMLPPVPCLPGEFNQVMLNLIINAAHAVADVVNAGKMAKGTITVATRWLGTKVEISIGDTGTGIPEAIRSRIFDPFFTTKPVGRGTGQGLAIAHSVIVQKHLGTITFETTEGKGTTFFIQLPLNVKASRRVNSATPVSCGLNGHAD